MKFLAAFTAHRHTGELTYREAYMLSYRHAFHAGNYADVIKHLVLVRILSYLTQKPKPLCYIETHAGAGTYRLDSVEAGKTGEHAQGIDLLWHQNKVPKLVAPYLDCIKSVPGNKGGPRIYPGSPRIAHHMLRPQDRLLLSELHPKDARLLQKHFAKASNVRCFEEDGFAKSLASVPPQEKRGMILVDPSYEMKEDYWRVVEHLTLLSKKFATGVLALWYPIADLERTQHMLTRLTKSGMKRIHLYELSLTEDHSLPGMTGTGMIVVNPPWVLKDEMEVILPYVAGLLGAGVKWRAHELVGE